VGVSGEYFSFLVGCDDREFQIRVLINFEIWRCIFMDYHSGGLSVVMLGIIDTDDNKRQRKPVLTDIIVRD
jgi:hypothetical protein